MTGAPPRASVRGGWRVRTDQATVALVCAVVVGLLAGVLAGLHGRGDIAVQVAPVQPVQGGGEQVPIGTVVIDGTQPVVFVVIRGHALRQPVTAVAPVQGATTVTVTSGLSPGSVVVVAPPPTVHDGSSVTSSPYASAAGR